MNSMVAISGFAVIGLALPPFLLMSLASLGLVTLRRGGEQGLLVLLACVALFVCFALLLAQAAGGNLILLAVLWLMVWFMAMVYRRTSMPAWMIYTAGAIGLLCVAGFYLQVTDPAAFWLAILDRHVKPLIVQQVSPGSPELDELLVGLAGVLTGVLAAMLSTVLIVSLFLARWWQSLLYNPGGFRREFYALRLGRQAAFVMIGLLAASLFGQYALSADMATVVWFVVLFSRHGRIAQPGWYDGNKCWLVGESLPVAGNSA